MHSQKSITKNSLFLAVRMLFTMAVSLFTARYVLINLGIVEFGVYGVIGGILGLFSFIQTTLVGASARFFAYELGKYNNLKGLFNQLNISITIHLIISVIIVFLAEGIGVYILNNYLTIPAHLKFDANIIYQITILNSIIIFLALPFEAILTSLEEFKIYAYIKMLDTVGKFLVAYFLFIAVSNKMIYYAIGLLLVTLITNYLYFYFSKKRIPDYQFNFIKDKKQLSPLLSFFSWDLYGNLSIILQSHGVNIIQNIFFGPIANASINISNQVHGALGSFSNNVLIATKPQIIKAYADRDFNSFNHLINLATKISFVISLIVSIPIFFNIHYILNIWLKSVPIYTYDYSKIAIIINIISISFSTITFAIHASGKIKSISLITGTLFMLILPVSYLFFKKGYPGITSYYIALFISFIASGVNIYLLKKIVPNFNLRLFFNTIIRLFFLGLITFVFAFYTSKMTFIKYEFINLIIYCIVNFIFIFSCFIFINLSTKERISLVKIVKKFI